MSRTVELPSEVSEALEELVDPDADRSDVADVVEFLETYYSNRERRGLSPQQREKLQDLLRMDHADLPDREVTAMIKLSLRNRLSPPQWLWAYEFPGPNGKRADAIAYCTTASRNYKIIGFEFKASRSDWLKEKRTPEKADYFAQICDEWYVVAGRKGIVEEEELPAGWGLFELKPNSGQIWQLVEAQPTEYQDREPDRRFYSTFLKKTVGKDSNFREEDLWEARRRASEDAKDRYGQQVEGMSDAKLRNLRRDAEKWEKIRDRGFKGLIYCDRDELQTLEKAFSLVEAIEGDRYSGLKSRIESLEDDLKQTFERAVQPVQRIEAAFEEIETDMDRLEDGSLSLEAYSDGGEET